jgi:hypothetical protein
LPSSEQRIACILISPMLATCPANHTLLDLITRIKLGEALKLWSPLCSLLQSPVTSTLLGSNILLRPCSQTPSIYIFPLMWETKFHNNIYMYI